MYTKILKNSIFVFTTLFYIFFFAEDADAIPQSSFVKVDLSIQRQSFSSPWQVQMKSDTRTAIYLGEDRFILHTPYPVSWIRSIRLNKKGLSELSATYVSHDAQLQLMIIRLDKEAMHLLAPSGLVRAQWSLDFNPVETGQRLQIISEHNIHTDRTVYFEKGNHAHLRGSIESIPMLHFTGNIQEVKTGDVVLHSKKILGIVMKVNKDSGRGLTLTYPLIKKFVLSHLPMNKNINIIDWRKKRNKSKLTTTVQTTGLRLKALKSPIQRRYYGLKRAEGASVITSVDPEVLKQYDIRRGDLIIRVDGIPVLSDGKIMDASYGIVDLSVFLRYRGGRPLEPKTTIKLQIQRDKKRKIIVFKLQPLSGRSLLIPEYNPKLSYAIFAGLLMHEVSGEYLRQNPKTPASVWNVYKSRALNQRGKRRRIVVLHKVFSLEINKGYYIKNIPILSIDGVIVENLKHAQELFRFAKLNRKQVLVGLQDGRLLVFDVTLLKKSNEEIRNRYGIVFLQ